MAAQKDLLSLQHLLGDKFHPLQPEAILAPEFEVAMVGGMGAGKSFALCVAALRHAIKFPGASVLIARLTFDDMVNTTKKFFFKIVEDKGLTSLFVRPRSWDYTEGTHLMRLTNKSEIRFSNLDKNLDRHKNYEYTFVGIDQLEEIEFAIYQILMLRCRSTVCPPNERKVMSVANDEGDNWIRHRFLTFEEPHGLPDPKLGRRLVRGGSFDNPHLDELTRRSYALMPAELQKRWVFATMDAGSSRLLPPFTIVEPFDVPRHWPRWLGVDPARSEGVTCAEWLTANPDKIAYRGVQPNGLHFYQEYWRESRDVEDHAADILRMSGSYQLRGSIMDVTSWASGVRSRGTGSLSVATLYLKAGLPVTPSVGDEWSRVMLYIEGGKRGLTISKACPHLLEQTPKYRIKGQMVGDSIQQRRIVAKAKFHAIDAGGYALSFVPTIVSGVEIRPVRDAIEVADTVDDGSRRHWEMENASLPKRRGRDSLVTVGLDEDEFHGDEPRSPYSRMNPVEDYLA